MSKQKTILTKMVKTKGIPNLPSFDPKEVKIAPCHPLDNPFPMEYTIKCTPKYAASKDF
jgi:hypothetical protein